MKRFLRSTLAALVVLVSTSWALAQPVATFRILLPEQPNAVTRAIADLLARQIAGRCDARVVDGSDAPLTVELAIAPGIGEEGFRIEDRAGGGVTIVGNEPRGLLYGVGKFLRASRYDPSGFRAGAWRGTSIPEKPVRGIYFATHFHNYYHDAPIDEVERYVEDVGLWGLNTLIVWYDMHHFNGFDSPEAVAFRHRLKAICGAARRIGLDVGFACVANEGYANSPEPLRADVKGMRGAAFPSDICTATDEGRQYVLDNFAQLYDWAGDLEPKWVMIWPYDSGGCGCERCRPWGNGGYLRIAEPLAQLAKRKFPGAKVMLSTWYLDGEEWTGLARAFTGPPAWIDYLMVEPAFLPDTPNAPPKHRAPAGLPLVGFPEISMVGWPVWGGRGANPLPSRYEREWTELKDKWQGGFPYSEGIFEDINKALFASFYWNAHTTADEALREYIAFEYSPDVIDLVLPAIHMLEKNAPSGRAGPWSLEALERIELADSRLTPQARRAWRWRILFLRAQIDARLYVNRGEMRGQVLHDAFDELTRIYHAHGADPVLRPPQVDPAESSAIVRPPNFQGPELAETYNRAVLSSKPVAYWRMDEVAGDAVTDASENGRSAKREAGVEFHFPTGHRATNPAGAFWGGRVSATIERLPLTYSVELWFRNDLPATARAITAYFFSRGVDGPPGTAGGDSLGIGGTYLPENQGRLFFFNGSQSDKVLSGTTSIEPGTWHHLVFVRHDGAISVHLDGGREPEIHGQAEIRFPADCRQLFLGARNDGFAPLEGNLDEVSIYDRALTPNEIASHYAAAGPQSPAPQDPNKTQPVKTQPVKTQSVTGQDESAAIPGVDDADIPRAAGGDGSKRRSVSPASAAYLAALRKNVPFGTNEFDLAGLRAGMGTRRVSTLSDIQYIPVKVDGIPCEWVVAPGADPDLRLLYLHGGGFVSGSGGFYLAMAAHISQAAKCAVLLPDYRLAPEHPFPAGLDDCVRAHEWMTANGPAGPAPCKATFVAGDSAGGNLTLATLLALRDRRMTLPAGGIAISPTTDFTLVSESLRTVVDPIISANTMPVFRDHYLGKSDPRNPLASPVFGDYRGIPPLLIQVGEHEMLRDDSVRVTKKARVDGLQVKLEVWPGMFHVFQSHEPLLPEAREAIDHAAEFMRATKNRQQGR